MSNNNEAIIEVTLYWPNLNRVNDMSGKYQVDYGSLSKEAIKTLQDFGIEVKTDPRKKEENPDRGQFVTAKSTFPFKVLFKQGVQVVDPANIGSGSKARVKFSPYAWTFKGKKGVSVSTKVVQITELVEYTRDEDPDFAGSSEAPDTHYDDMSLDDVFSAE